MCRAKKDAKGEHNAKEISDSLPFLEYDMYSSIINKLRVKGMNAVFNLRVRILHFIIMSRCNFFTTTGERHCW